MFRGAGEPDPRRSSRVASVLPLVVEKGEAFRRGHGLEVGGGGGGGGNGVDACARQGKAGVRVGFVLDTFGTSEQIGLDTEAGSECRWGRV
jgi:hypothetical protein